MRLNLPNMMFKRIDITVPDIPGHNRKTALYQQLMKMSIFIIISKRLKTHRKRHLKAF